MKNMGYWLLLMVTYTCLFVGSPASSMLSRFYFSHGGKSKWVSTWVQSAGFPLLLIPIYFPYLYNMIITKFNKNNSLTQQHHEYHQNHQYHHHPPFSQFTPKLFTLYSLIGLMLGLNNFLISFGISYLPISTASLLLSTQLAFNLILSIILVKQKINFTNLNSVILITLSSVLLALDSKHDRPKNVSRGEYYMGFFSILGAGLLFALYLPIMEVVYKHVNSYQMMLEAQMVMQAASTVFATVGMVADGGFVKMREESTRFFDLGPTAYQLSLGFNIVTWQMCFLGTAGLVFLTSSLTGGVCATALLPVNVIGGVVIFRDGFSGIKGVSTSMSLWGFCSYLYGEYKNMKGKSSTTGTSTTTTTALIVEENEDSKAMNRNSSDIKILDESINYV
ncbi:hypothetical protein Sjap_024279 [Stephania japonica]|uniref:Probable purine permease n=1 Tax=Stephania japonica TaxID=461633 RepID=A0AAP0EGC0_9MAGN